MALPAGCQLSPEAALLAHFHHKIRGKFLCAPHRVGDGEFAACSKGILLPLLPAYPPSTTFQLQHPLLPPATPPAPQGFL